MKNNWQLKCNYMFVMSKYLSSSKHKWSCRRALLSMSDLRMRCPFSTRWRFSFPFSFCLFKNKQTIETYISWLFSIKSLVAMHLTYLFEKFEFTVLAKDFVDAVPSSEVMFDPDLVFNDDALISETDRLSFAFLSSSSKSSTLWRCVLKRVWSVEFTDEMFVPSCSFSSRRLSFSRFSALTSFRRSLSSTNFVSYCSMLSTISCWVVSNEGSRFVNKKSNLL